MRPVIATSTYTITLKRHTFVNTEGDVVTTDPEQVAAWVQRIVQRAYDSWLPSLYEVSCVPVGGVEYSE